MSGYNDIIKKYETAYKIKHNIPELTYKVSCLDFGDFVSYDKMTCRLWVDNNSINLVSIDNCSEREKVIINIDDIAFYNRIGDMHSYSDISSDNKPSIKGAVVGGILAGGVGAIIGSKINSNNIKTELKTVDNRIVFMEVNKDGLRHILKFKSEDYDIFIKLIPNKEKGYVDNNRSNNTEDVYSQLEKLASLKDSGILTEEEFAQKKEILLKKIV